MIYGRYKFVVRFEDSALLPYYKGRLFRSVIGNHLRKSVCSLSDMRSCSACTLKINCAYAMIFSRDFNRPPAHKDKKTLLSVSPFVFEPTPSVRHQYDKGETIDCTLLLFGYMNRNIPYLIHAFDLMGRSGIGKMKMGKRSRFVLESVTAIDPYLTIYSREIDTIRLPERFYNLIDTTNESGHLSIDRVGVEIMTPLGIAPQMGAEDTIPFPILFRNMVDRVCSLLDVYGDGVPDIDYSALFTKSETIKISFQSVGRFDWRRFSQSSAGEKCSGWFTGSIEYRGDFTDLLPWMIMAETVHIGRNTSSGLGRIRLILR